MKTPWQEYPHLWPTSIDWSNLEGADYLRGWQKFYDGLSEEEKSKYRKENKAPFYWFFFYLMNDEKLLSWHFLFVMIIGLTYPFRRIHFNGIVKSLPPRIKENQISISGFAHGYEFETLIDKNGKGISRNDFGSDIDAVQVLNPEVIQECYIWLKNNEYDFNNRPESKCATFTVVYEGDELIASFERTKLKDPQNVIDETINNIDAKLPFLIDLDKE